MSVAYPPIVPRLEEIKSTFAATDIEYFVQPYVGSYEGRQYPQSYTEQERQILRRTVYSRHDYEFLLNLKRPGLCNAGYKYIYVQPNGAVHPCGGANHQRILGDLSLSPEIQLTQGPSPCPAKSCQCDTENINTVDFENYYRWSDKNQHKFIYKFTDEARQFPWMDEWAIPY